jgi:DNA-binding NarL/FixJ family response regulator
VRVGDIAARRFQLVLIEETALAIRVLICDRRPVIADGLKTLLGAVPDIDVIGETQDGMEAITLVRTTGADVVVTDLDLQTISGLEMIRRLGKEPPPGR